MSIDSVNELPVTISESVDNTDPVDSTEPVDTSEPIDTTELAESVDSTEHVDNTEPVDLFDTVIEQGDLSVLNSFLETTGLSTVLADDTTQTTYTLFAPTDAAFEALDDDVFEALMADTDQLENLLRYHLAPSTITSGMVFDLVGQSLTMINGAETTIGTADSQATINDSTLTTMDIIASNGVIHRIDTILTMPDPVISTPQLREVKDYSDFAIIRSRKKGIGANDVDIIRSSNVSWWYNWNINLTENVPENIDYVAMRHGRWWPSLQNLSSTPTSFLLGLNEPDAASQGNTTVNQAISLWPTLVSTAEQYDLDLCGPATTNFNDEWIAEFMAEAEARDYRIDAMCMHWYKGPNSNQFMNNIATYYNTYDQRDIWITEFNVADWDGNNTYTMAQTYTFLAESLHRMEATDYIKGYAIFPWRGTTEVSKASPIILDGTTELTELGHLYAGFESADIYGPYPETWYHLHQKGSHLRLVNNGNAPVADSIEVTGPSAQFKLVAANENTFFIVNRSTGEKLRYNGNTVHWDDGLGTGTWVQWRLIDQLHGWKFIENVGFNEQLVFSDNMIQMAALDASDNGGLWRFVRPNTSWSTLNIENFEEGKGLWDNDNLDNQLYTGGTLAGSGNNALNLNVANATTESLSVREHDDLHIAFTYFTESAATEVSLHISTDGGINYNTAYEWRGANKLTHSQFVRDEVTIRGISLSDETHLRFVMDSVGAEQDLYLDDIVISAK